MMSLVYLRADDFEEKDLMDFFVKKDVDQENIDMLKSEQPILVVGSRGTGKTMLLRVADKTMNNDFEKTRVLSVYLSLTSSEFIDESKLRKWMLYKVLLYLSNSLRRAGFNIKSSFLKRVSEIDTHPVIAKLEKYMDNLQGINEPGTGDEIPVDGDAVTNDVDNFKLFVAELCLGLNINKIVVLFDEACQNFNPQQQRTFFDMFKDLRSPYIVCKAAVYPGLVSYGNFQKAHDVSKVVYMQRDILHTDYVGTMREIVKKYFLESYDNLLKTGEVLDCIIYCSTGNPRFLIRTIEQALGNSVKLKTESTNVAIKEFYRGFLWEEHNKLANRYSGHAELINWGNEYIDKQVVPDIEKWNNTNTPNGNSTLFFGIERLSATPVIEALKILEYSGIITLNTEAVKYRDGVFMRYLLNFGVFLTWSKDSNPVKSYKEVIKKLTLHNYPTYTKNSKSYGSSFECADKLKESVIGNDSANKRINAALSLSTERLDLTNWSKRTLLENGYRTVSEILNSDEKELRKIPHIGVVRSSNIMNEAYNAIIEYISG